MTKTMTAECRLTRGTKDLISQAINRAGTNNRYDVCNTVVEIMMERYEGLTLDYQADRMNLATTGAILTAIDTYFFKHYKAA